MTDVTEDDQEEGTVDKRGADVNVALECRCKAIYDSKQGRLKCKNMGLAQARLNKTMTLTKATARSKVYSGFLL